MAPHTSGPTTASEVFSATDSTVARARPAASRPDGSRPQRWLRRCRAPSRSPVSSSRDISCASRRRLVPPTTAHVARAVTPAVGRLPGTARSAARPSAAVAPVRTRAYAVPGQARVAVHHPLRRRCHRAEAGDGVARARVGPQQIGGDTGGEGRRRRAMRRSGAQGGGLRARGDRRSRETRMLGRNDASRPRRAGQHGSSPCVQGSSSLRDTRVTCAWSASCRGKHAVHWYTRPRGPHKRRSTMQIRRTAAALSTVTVLAVSGVAIATPASAQDEAGRSSKTSPSETSRSRT
jgi:hypothetical protein